MYIFEQIAIWLTI